MQEDVIEVARQIVLETAKEVPMLLDMVVTDVKDCVWVVALVVVVVRVLVVALLAPMRFNLFLGRVIVGIS